jgi:hypothetical protein
LTANCPANWRVLCSEKSASVYEPTQHISQQIRTVIMTFVYDNWNTGILYYSSSLGTTDYMTDKLYIDCKTGSGDFRLSSASRSPMGSIVPAGHVFHCWTYHRSCQSS